MRKTRWKKRENEILDTSRKLVCATLPYSGLQAGYFRGCKSAAPLKLRPERRPELIGYISADVSPRPH
jgi:hypothetical protein